MKTLKLILVITLIALVISSCKKEGTGGKATITGHVKHHEVHISDAIVYIKYGATELPGTNASDYDNQVVASSGDGHYEFSSLQKGDYYLYATGYDGTISATVKGGVPVKIKKKKETVDIDIPVTE